MKKEKIIPISLGIITLISIILFNYVKEWNGLFMALLLVNLTLAIIFYRYAGKEFRYFAALITGIVFMYSGFVKGVDPWGSMFKFDEYFEVLGIQFLKPFALFFAILLSSLEFIIGFALIFKIRMKIFSVLLLLFMAVFTPMTLYLAIANPVADCGCFGDAFIITNWQTLYKNLILLVFTFILLLNRKNISELFKPLVNWGLIVISSVFILWVSVHSNNHLPLIDFLDYKIENRMVGKPGVVVAYLTYKNKKTGELKEMLSSDLPWNDSIWMAEWEFDCSRSEEIGGIPAYQIKIMDEKGDNIELSGQGLQFLVFAYNIEKANKKSFEKLNELNLEAEKAGIPFIGASGSVPEKVELFRHEVQAMFPVYMADETALKTAIRSNPGLILLKDGVIVGKWAYRDIPDFDFIKREFL